MFLGVANLVAITLYHLNSIDSLMLLILGAPFVAITLLRYSLDFKALMIGRNNGNQSWLRFQHDLLLKRLTDNHDEITAERKECIKRIEDSWPCDNSKAKLLHKQALNEINTQANLNSYRDYALGIRLGWYQSGVISATEFEVMSIEIDRHIKRYLNNKE